jgi:hypothetical protein
VAEAQRTARATAHRRNIEAARAASVAEVRNRHGSQYTLSSYPPWQQRVDEQRTFTSFLGDTERRRRERVTEERHRRRVMLG